MSVYLPLGHSYFSLRRYERAARAFREAARFSPESAQVHLYLGHSLCELKQFERAAEAYRHAIALDPDEAQTHLSRPDLRRDGGQGRSSGGTKKVSGIGRVL